ncbi:BRO1 domain-containing protein BROX [Turdus rufiventris]|nr:BRO1 domain-containing protein BROX [Turdus rufiventris]
MTHWFHRNPLKATAPVSFNFYGVATTPAATKVCNDLRLSRTRLLELFTDSSCNPEMMKNAAELYFSLLQGFILSLDDSSQECKLRYIQNFKWTDTLQGQVPSAQQDAVFELVSMGFNVALWYTKYASRLAGKEDITEDEAKDVHRSLKIAAGIFKHLKESHIPKLITPVEKGRDLEARLIDSYIIQCQAEAQEVTIARAIELKHNPGLIAALAYETANFYQKAVFAKAEALCKEYGETKGPGTTAKPSGHLFFRKLGSLIKNTLEKCQRENGFIYFQKVPAEAPQLELKANYGLVEPVPFEFPALNAHWTPETVAAFDLTKRPKEDTAKPKPDEEVKPLKEPDIKPQKDSGCQIS